jgi:hypothetical protein
MRLFRDFMVPYYFLLPRYKSDDCIFRRLDLISHKPNLRLLLLMIISINIICSMISLIMDMWVTQGFVPNGHHSVFVVVCRRCPESPS